MEKIKFKIGPTGIVEAEGEGFQGKSCMEKSEKYLRKLGKVTDQKMKPDFYVQVSGANTVHI